LQPKLEDAQIQADVLAELKYEPRLQPNEIGVIVKTAWSR